MCDNMNLKKFYKTIDDIVLYPGSVKELNDRERKKNSGKTFEEIPLNHGKKYIEGIVLPEMSSVKETVTTVIKVTSPKNEEYAEIIHMLSEIYSGITGLDLRIKAKKLKADGFVHLQYVGQSSLNLRDSKFGEIVLAQYIGVPVRLIQ